jgi:hypothetical protein
MPIKQEPPDGIRYGELKEPLQEAAADYKMKLPSLVKFIVRNWLVKNGYIKKGNP